MSLVIQINANKCTYVLMVYFSNSVLDVDECESSGICGAMSKCVNTEGSYRCECLPGFRAAGPGRQCRGQRYDIV